MKKLKAAIKAAKKFYKQHPIVARYAILAVGLSIVVLAVVLRGLFS